MKSVYSDRYERFRQLMVEARKQVGLTQAELATRLSKPQSFVSKYENGERRLDIVEFVDVVEAIGCDPGPLLDVIRALPRLPERTP